uniref:Uncharacterized protein n=1 Tax=Globodera pallida TaxID=36090 RepID=A0A183BVQ8_GLOPA
MPSENAAEAFAPADLLPQCIDNFVLSSEVRTETDSMANDESNSSANGASNVLTEIETDKEQPQPNSDGHFSILHILEYVGLELHYAITGTYKFAVPTITPKCKCDCAGGEEICNIEKYQYRNCSVPGGACYRTHRGGQPNGGCLSSGKAEICCQVEIKPYKDWTFQAVRLKQPSMVFILRYRILERIAEGRQWTSVFNDQIAIPLNKGATKFELNGKGKGQRESDGGEDGAGRHRVEISAVGGTPQRQMEPGMYFYKIEDAESGHRLRDGVALNGPGESSLEKLGWFRWERGQGWVVRKGLEKITQAQHVSVEDCKAQRYRATFNAEQLVLRGHSEIDGGSSSADEPSTDAINGKEADGTEEMSNFDLGNLVEVEPWAGAVRTGEREVVLEHAEGVALTLTLRTESWPRIIHHRSQLSDFSGSIVLDKESNLYLNLTFFNARGTLIGQIFSSQDSLSVMESIFSIDISKNTQRKSQRVVATSVRSPRLVCFYPMGSLEGRKCHRLDFVRQPLQDNPPMTDQWQRQRSECQGKGVQPNLFPLKQQLSGCNERGVESFLTSLDPRQWLDGLNSPAELFTCLVELVLCLVLLLLAVLLMTKCVFPLCRCVRFVVRPAKCKKYTGHRETGRE